MVDIFLRLTIKAYVRIAVTFNELQQSGDRLTGKETKALWNEIADTYKLAYREIRKQIRETWAILAGIPAEDWPYHMNRYSRLTKLSDSVLAEFRKAAVKAGRLQMNAGRVSIANNYYRQQYAVDFGVSIPSFVVLPSKVIEVSVLGTQKVWADIGAVAKAKMEATFGSLSQYQPKYGTLTDILTKNMNAELSALKSAINQGITQGKAVGAVAKDILKIFDTTASNAERIYRTETHRNRSNADWANYQQLNASGVELWREIVSTLDDRTRAQSATVDGRIDKDGTGFRYPNGNKYIVPGSTGVPEYDINDRERTIQIIPGVDGDVMRRGKDPVTGKNEVFSYKNFDDWAKEKGLKRNRYGELLNT